MDSLDARDQAILKQRALPFEAAEGSPRIGEFVRFADGVTRRFSYDWGDGLQTSDGGSFYLGDGFASFSGCLYTSIPLDNLTITDERRSGTFWFFHHDVWGAHRGVQCEVKCRVWKASIDAPKS